MTGAVMAAGRWRTNGELVADVARLYPLTGAVVDLTYGSGTFWSCYRPSALVAHDLDPHKGDGVSWDDLPETTGSVDVVVFDPPYVSPGGRATSTLPQMVAAYGMHTTKRSPEAQWSHICDGISEAHRVLRPGGLLLLKCMDYVSSGRKQWVSAWAHRDLPPLGFVVVDEFVMVGGAGPQPTTNLDGSPRRQVHSRTNHSRLFVAVAS